MGRKIPWWFLAVWCAMVSSVGAQDAGVPTEAPGNVPSKTSNAAPATTSAPATTATTQAPSTSEETAAEAVAPPASGPDLSVVRSDLASVMDELIAARARVSVLSKALFNTPLSVRVVRRADDQRLEHITLRLDGVPVHDSDGAALARGEAELFQGYAAPGVHEVAIEVTEVSKMNADYRYVRSERFQIEIKKGMRTRIELVLRDKSDMAEELREDDEGEYDVRTLMRVEAESVKD